MCVVQKRYVLEQTEELEPRVSALDEDLEADDDDDDEEEEEEEEEEKVSLFLSPSLLKRLYRDNVALSLLPILLFPLFTTLSCSPFSPPPSRSSHHLGVDPPVHRGRERSRDTAVPADRHTEEVGVDLRQREEGGATHGLHGDIDTDLPLPEGTSGMQSNFRGSYTYSWCR